MRAMPDASTRSERVRVANHVDALDGALRAAERFAVTVGLEADDARVLRLVVEELLTNAITHGQAPSHAFIDLALDATDRGVRIECVDRGRPFDPNRDLPPPLLEGDTDVRPVGGLGWVLIRHHCSRIDYRRDGDENHLRLLCRLPRSR